MLGVHDTLYTAWNVILLHYFPVMWWWVAYTKLKFQTVAKIFFLGPFFEWKY